MGELNGELRRLGCMRASASVVPLSAQSPASQTIQNIPTCSPGSPVIQKPKSFLPPSALRPPPSLLPLRPSLRCSPLPLGEGRGEGAAFPLPPSAFLICSKPQRLARLHLDFVKHLPHAQFRQHRRHQIQHARRNAAEITSTSLVKPAVMARRKSSFVSRTIPKSLGTAPDRRT